MRQKRRYTIQKHGGDDSLSWAVIDRETGRVVVNGCGRDEARYHRQQIERRQAAKEANR